MKRPMRCKQIHVSFGSFHHLFFFFVSLGEDETRILNIISSLFNTLSPSIKLQILLLCFQTFLTEVVGESNLSGHVFNSHDLTN